MTLSDLIDRLQNSGELIFDSSAPPEVDTDASARLLALDEQRRLEAAFEAPKLDFDSAIWAARLMFRVCQFLVDRALPASQVESDLSEPCPGKPSPEQAWSIDLTFRRLPELTQRAVQVAEADPLVQQLLKLAWNWPLSSVGIPLDVPENGPVPDLTAILASRSLKMLYVDRILETGDTSRLHDPEIRAAVADAIGGHPELAPEFAKLLQAEL